MPTKHVLQIFTLILCGLFIGCTVNTDEYTHREDTLLGGLSFGMTQKEFFDHCLSQQKLGIMRDGLGNFVQQDMPQTYIDKFSKVEYYPSFDDELRIRSLPGRVYSVAWSPWSKHLFPDSIIQQVLVYFEDTFEGTKFEKVEKAPILTYVKTDQNRRIVVRTSFTQFVEFDITDLSVATKEVKEGKDLLEKRNNISPLFQAKKNAQ